MNTPTFTLFVLLYGAAAAYCGWCLCFAWHKLGQLPKNEIGNVVKNCDDKFRHN